MSMKQPYNKAREREREKEITFDNNKHIEDAIACITSTAEQIASLTFWTSACRNNKADKKIIRPNLCKCVGKWDQKKENCHILLPQQQRVDGVCWPAKIQWPLIKNGSNLAP